MVFRFFFCDIRNVEVKDIWVTIYYQKKKKKQNKKVKCFKRSLSL